MDKTYERVRLKHLVRIRAFYDCGTQELGPVVDFIIVHDDHLRCLFAFCFGYIQIVVSLYSVSLLSKLSSACLLPFSTLSC